MSSSPMLGECLRAYRRRNGLTLQEVGRRTGVALSTLSKVENNKMSLTYDKLLQICERLGCSIHELLSVEPNMTLRRTRRSITSPDNTIRQQTRNFDYSYLTTDLVSTHMVPMLAVVHAHSLADYGPLSRHSGEEFFYVLSGTVELHTEHYAPARLGTGGSAYLDATMGHAIISIGDEDAVILSLCSTPTIDLRRELAETFTGLQQPGPSGQKQEEPLSSR